MIIKHTKHKGRTFILKELHAVAWKMNFETHQYQIHFYLSKFKDTFK